MSYNFDQIIDRRNTNSLSADGFRSYLLHATSRRYERPDNDFIRMWVADMDFAVADEILDAVRARLDQKILGYTQWYDDTYYDALSSWSERHYGWRFPKEQLCFSPGIVPALYTLAGLICRPQEKVLIFTPSYAPFAGAARSNELELVFSPLQRGKDGFTIDFDDFATKAADPAVKLCIFCNPHNPTGRVWTKDELSRVAKICHENDVYLISDEIHCDLLRTGLSHTPLAACAPEPTRVVTCTAPSKTFNIAGLQFSNIVIPDEALRRRWNEVRDAELNPLSLAAATAAYQKGEPWLTELRAYLDGNFAMMDAVLKRELPDATFSIPQATYLGWVDVGAYVGPEDNLAAIGADAGVVLQGGDGGFVHNAQTSMRLNLACPRALAEEGLKRVCHALKR